MWARGVSHCFSGEIRNILSCQRLHIPPLVCTRVHAYARGLRQAAHSERSKESQNRSLDIGNPKALATQLKQPPDNPGAIHPPFSRNRDTYVADRHSGIFKRLHKVPESPTARTSVELAQAFSDSIFPQHLSSAPTNDVDSSIAVIQSTPPLSVALTPAINGLISLVRRHSVDDDRPLLLASHGVLLVKGRAFGRFGARSARGGSERGW